MNIGSRTSCRNEFRQRELISIRLVTTAWQSVFWLATALVCAPASRAVEPVAKLPASYKLLYEQNFGDATALKDFVFTDPKAWRISKEEKRSSLELFGQSNYQPAHRSPLNIALLADRVFGDFVLEVELLSTVKPYGHQDMCLFFGVQEPLKFYYVHLAVAADANAHNVFIVNNAPRKNFARETTKGITWGQDTWHKVRIERTLAEGTIKVYFDDLGKPIMVAEDKTFVKGGIGFGSFDDLGKIGNIKIWGPKMETKPTEFFKKLTE